MSLVRITAKAALELQKTMSVVSPHTAPPYRPLRVLSVNVSPSETVMIKVDKDLFGAGWVRATAFWWPPAGYVWSPMKQQWLFAKGGQPWARPSLEEVLGE